MIENLEAHYQHLLIIYTALGWVSGFISAVLILFVANSIADYKRKKTLLKSQKEFKLHRKSIFQ